MHDARRLQSAAVPQCKVEISGFWKRVSWGSPDSLLTLHISYPIALTSCQQGAQV